MCPTSSETKMIGEILFYPIFSIVAVDLTFARIYWKWSYLLTLYVNLLQSVGDVNLQHSLRSMYIVIRGNNFHSMIRGLGQNLRHGRSPLPCLQLLLLQVSLITKIYTPLSLSALQDGSINQTCWTNSPWTTATTDGTWKDEGQCYLPKHCKK